MAPSRKSEAWKTLEQQENHAELSKHFEKLLCYREALYHPDSKQKLFIVNAGFCLQRNCQRNSNLQMVKVALPGSSKDQFVEPIPSELIGKRVVCFKHYPFDVQMQYLATGSFPADAKMVQKSKTIKSTATTKTKKTTKATKPIGIQRAFGAFNNDDSWVRSIFTITATAEIENCHDNPHKRATKV